MTQMATVRVVCADCLFPLTVLTSYPPVVFFHFLGFLSKGEYIELAKCVHVTKEAGVTASGFSRYSAEAASDRNFKLAQKAFDVLSNVVEKRADDRTAETGQKVITFASVALVVVGAAAGYLIARSR